MIVELPEGPPEIIVQRDDGMWQIGWGDDAPGPFQSRDFAEAVAAEEVLHATS